MAIVMAVTSGTAAVRIDDSYCAGVDAAEIARRWAAADAAARRAATGGGRHEQSREDGGGGRRGAAR